MDNYLFILPCYFTLHISTESNNVSNTCLSFSQVEDCIKNKFSFLDTLKDSRRSIGVN